MEGYKRKLRLRLAWWWVWWVICAYMFFGSLIELTLLFVDTVFFSHWSPGAAYVVAKVVILFIFIIPTFWFFPSVDRLLAKDLKKNKYNLYAKAISLERKLIKNNKVNNKVREDKEIKDAIEKMEQKLSNDHKA